MFSVERLPGKGPDSSRKVFALIQASGSDLGLGVVVYFPVSLSKRRSVKPSSSQRAGDAAAWRIPALQSPPTKVTPLLFLETLNAASGVFLTLAPLQARTRPLHLL